MEQVIELPVCGHRKEQSADGLYLCDSPKLIPNPGKRSGDFCRKCPYHDNGPLHELKAPIPTRITDQQHKYGSVDLSKCIFHGETVRDSDGSVKTKDCPTCGGLTNKQPIFKCVHPLKPMGEEVTLIDCGKCKYKPVPIQLPAKKLILFNGASPGDHLVMTAAVDALVNQPEHKGKYIVDVICPCPDIYLNNPSVTKLDHAGIDIGKWFSENKGKDRLELSNGTLALHCHHNLIHKSNERPNHFLQDWADYLGKQLGINLEVQVNHPLLYFSDQEKSWIGRVQELIGENKKYWVIVEGCKWDYTTKKYIYSYWQEVVNRLNDYFQGDIILVQAGEDSPNHFHEPLEGVMNQIGKTTTREFIRLCWSSQGGIGAESFIQHIYAALQYPFVAIYGGRVPPNFFSYNTQTTLHTVGKLKCCATGGCWHSRTVALGDGEDKDNDLCVDTVKTAAGEIAQRCMAIIKPSDVVNAVKSYYEGGRLER